LLLLPACVHRYVLPDDLEGQVDWTLPYEYLMQNPGYYQGRLVCFGGVVLSARRLDAGTRIEILQMPLDENHEPLWDRSLSQGRFVAYQKEFLDPETLPRGMRVTVAGTVRGPETAALDDTQYTYPALDVRTLILWRVHHHAPPPRTHVHIGIGGVIVR
jgi:outer membrane lipoprotein